MLTHTGSNPRKIDNIPSIINTTPGFISSTTPPKSPGTATPLSQPSEKQGFVIGISKANSGEHSNNYQSDLSPGRGPSFYQYPGTLNTCSPEAVIQTLAVEVDASTHPHHIKTSSGNVQALGILKNPSTKSSHANSQKDLHNQPSDAPNTGLTGTLHTLFEDKFLPVFDQKALLQHAARVATIWPHPTHEAKLQYPEFCDTYERIKYFNLPNSLGARIPLKSGLNIDRWEHHLQNYHDREVCSFLRYGWPLGYSGNQPPVSIEHNHPSGDNHKSHIRHFIEVELAHNAIVGPFTADPFFPWTRKSPIMSRPKKGLNESKNHR